MDYNKNNISLRALAGPCILLPRMPLTEPCPLPILEIVLSRGAPRHSILIPDDASPPQLREQILNHILESARGNGAREIKSIHAGNINPPLQDIRNGGGRANRPGMRATQGQFLENAALRPFQSVGVRHRLRPARDHGLDPAHRGKGKVLVVCEFGQVVVRPAAEERRHAFQV